MDKLASVKAYIDGAIDVRDDLGALRPDIKLRPILTTSITTIVGVIPLALSDPTWFPLASAIGFGLVASTLPLEQYKQALQVISQSFYKVS